jgi:hypothetical protein
MCFRLGEPPFLLQRPAQGNVRRRRARGQGQYALPAGDGFGVFFALGIQLGEVLPEDRAV